MSTLRLIIYLIGIIATAVGIALLPAHFHVGLSVLVSALVILTLLGWRNVIYAILVGIVAGDPTENIPEGEEVE